jgi:hypothetical protein
VSQKPPQPLAAGAPRARFSRTDQNNLVRISIVEIEKSETLDLFFLAGCAFTTLEI